MNKTSKLISTLCLSALATSLVLSSCSKKDDNPNPSPSIEVTQNSELLKLLQAPANGWEVALYPSNNQRHGGYTLFLNFSNDGTVNAASELLESEALPNSKYEVSTKESTQTLSFTTANPAISLTTESTDTTLSQLSAYRDEIFVVESSSSSEIRLKGKTNGSIAILRPASTQPWAEQLSAIKAMASNNTVLHFGLRNETEEIGTGEVRVANRHLSITEKNGATQSQAFRYTATGIELFAPLTVQGLQMQKLTSEQSSTSASFKAGESNLSLVAIATPLSELLRTGLFTYSKENTTGRALRSFTRMEGLISRLNNGIVEEDKQAKISNLQIGSREGVFGLHLTYRLANVFGRGASQEFQLRLPLQMTAENSHRVTFTYDLVAITNDANLERFTTNSPFLQILASGFARIGQVRTSPTGSLTYNESYQGLNFDLTADNPFRPTEITLTCKDLREEYSIKLQVPQN